MTEGNEYGNVESEHRADVNHRLERSLETRQQKQQAGDGYEKRAHEDEREGRDQLAAERW
jgi:hypothetical protein